ncbi:MAG TPA: corrinoid protein [Anaerovoracaceae bacterium]|nr:corrinoid protein [Anaerovoracaceae bacterium]
MSKLQELVHAIENGETKQAAGLVQEVLDEGVAPIDILNKGMIEAMAVVGEKFKNDEIFIAEMLVAARAMKRGVEILTPHLTGEGNISRGKVVMGTVSGDLHDIGKNLVTLMIESAGFEVVDLGVDVPAVKFVEAASDPEVNIVGVSSLLTTTMPAMKEIVAALNECSNRKNFKIMVGGAPITQEFCDKIGADIYTSDAGSAAEAAVAAV